MNKNTKLIVLDVDDTLYLERDYVQSGFMAVGKWVGANFGVNGFGEAAWSLFEEGTRGDTFNQAAAKLGLDLLGEDVRNMVGVYREHTPEIFLASDAHDYIIACHRAKLHIAVITDGPASSQAAKVKALGLARWCDPIILTARLGEGKGKPDPRSFELAAASVDVAPEQCLYIADNPHKDFVAPMALGWQSIRMIRAGGLHADAPTPAGVTRVVSSFDEIWRPSS
jgi:putative hydrolase of the HAD superfamily